MVHVFKSIKTQLFLLSAAIIIIPLTVCNIFSYYIVSHDVATKLREENLAFAMSVSQNIRSFLAEAYVVTVELATNGDLLSPDPYRQQQLLMRAEVRNSQFDLFYMQKLNGWQIANSRGIPGSDRSGRWWFKEFITNRKPFISKSYFTTTDNTAVVSIFIPVYSASGLAGVLGADLKLKTIQELLDLLHTSKSGSTYILDSEGTIVAHPNKTFVAELYNFARLTRTILITGENGVPVRDQFNNHVTRDEPIQVPPGLRQAALRCLKGESGTIEYQDLAGQDMVCTYATINLPENLGNWAVITVNSKTDAMATASRIIRKNNLIALVSLILSIFLIYALSRRITQPIRLMDKQIEHIIGGRLQQRLAGNFGSTEIEHLATSFETMRLSLAKLHTERESMFLSTIHSLIAALESKDDYTCSHSMEVAELAATITAELGLAEQEQFKIKFAALLHDIGKIGIPDSVLHKQGELTDEEWQTMKQHPEIGAKIISTIPNMEDIVDIIRYHHARWDGSGYPYEIAGEAIPLGARIIAVADSFQAMTSDRPYRKALPLDFALAEIRQCAGKQFDGRIVELFLKQFT